ncbi:MAG TPA: transcriptional repressor [Clostridiales bacterium]|nr:transcriptional repressor [Clostridiales bacterium]
MAKRNTRQKRLISETLLGMNHPSATMVFEEVRKKDTKISRATVFRVLADAAASRTLQRLHIPGSDDRFDINTAKHFHISCRACGRVDDIEVAEPEITLLKGSIDARGYRIEDWNIDFVGLCPECAGTKN